MWSLVHNTKELEINLMSIHQANEYITSEIDIKRYTIHHCKSELYESEIMHRQP